jgi:hypothetical protein
MLMTARNLPEPKRPEGVRRGASSTRLIPKLYRRLLGFASMPEQRGLPRFFHCGFLCSLI